MARYGWNVVIARPVIPIGGTRSSGFSVPRAASSMVVFAPALEAASTAKLQTLSPDTPEDTEVWSDITFVGGDIGTAVVLSATLFPTAGTTVVIEVPWHVGGGVLSILASAAQTTAARRFHVTFHF